MHGGSQYEVIMRIPRARFTLAYPTSEQVLVTNWSDTKGHDEQCRAVDFFHATVSVSVSQALAICQKVQTHTDCCLFRFDRAHLRRFRHSARKRETGTGYVNLTLLTFHPASKQSIYSYTACQGRAFSMQTMWFNTSIAIYYVDLGQVFCLAKRSERGTQSFLELAC